MQNRESALELHPEIRSLHQAEGLQGEEASPVSQYDLLNRVCSPPAGTVSPEAHASVLNRATDFRPSRAGRSLLQLQRQYGNRYVQRVLDLARTGEGEAEVSPDVEQAIQRSRGGGQALDSGTRAQMESAFGADFSGVRVHADAGSDALSQSLNARAFTTGHDVFFRRGAYNPSSSGGQELLAHELTHVVQQMGDEVRSKLTVNAPGDLYEQEADQMAREVVQRHSEEGKATPGPQSSSMLQRFEWLWGGSGTLTPTVVVNDSGQPMCLGESANPGRSDYVGASVRVSVEPEGLVNLRIKEHLGTLVENSGAFSSFTPPFDLMNRREGWTRVEDFPRVDEHGLPIGLLASLVDNYTLSSSPPYDEPSTRGRLVFHQLDIYSVPGRASQSVVPNSGYRITHELRTRDRTIYFVIWKEATACVIDGTSTGPGRGGITQTTVEVDRLDGRGEEGEENYSCSVPEEVCSLARESMTPGSGVIQRYVSPPSSPTSGLPIQQPIGHQARHEGRTIDLPLRYYDDATLYGPHGGPRPEHVEQGSTIGDCWLMSALAALASTERGRAIIISHIRPNHEISPTQSRTYTVTLYNLLTGDPQHYRMEPVFPAGVASTRPEAIYGGRPGTGGILWVALYERAMAHHRGSYANVQTPGIRATAALQSVTGTRGLEIWDVNSDNASSRFESIRSAFTSGQPVVISTRRGISESSPYQGAHGYTVIGVQGDGDRRRIVVRNPWGPRGRGDPQLEVSPADLGAYFNLVTIGQLPSAAGPRSGGCTDSGMAGAGGSDLPGQLLQVLLP